MAIQKAMIIGFTIVGDGTTATFTLDLLHDAYFLLFGSSSVGEVANWFSKNPQFPQPTGVTGVSPNSATLSGTTITYTFATGQIPTGQQSVELTLTF